MAENSGRDGTQSIRRAMAVLKTLAASQGTGISLLEITERTGLSRPTAHRILKTLISGGFTEQKPRSHRYMIGEEVPLLALARPQRPALLDASEAILDRVARKVGDTAFLTIRTGNDTLCLSRRLGQYPIQVLVIEVGARRPLGVSTAGLAILSCLESEDASRIIKKMCPVSQTIEWMKR